MFWSFDTSSIPVDATIDFVTLTLTPAQVEYYGVAQDFEVYAFDWPPLDSRPTPYLTQSHLEDLYGSPGRCAYHPLGTMVANTAAVFTGESAFKGAITRGGATRLMMTVESNRTGVDPQMHCRCKFYMANSTTQAYRPKLVIEYSPADTPSASLPVTVDYATANGTATAGSDFIAASGSLVFAPGETSKSVSVAVQGDAEVEPDETFLVNLSGAATLRSPTPAASARSSTTIRRCRVGHPRSPSPPPPARPPATRRATRCPSPGRPAPTSPTGEYGVWAEASNGNWYGGDLVAASAPHSHDLTLAVPVGTGYRIAVMYRPTAGSGAWSFPVAYSPGVRRHRPRTSRGHRHRPHRHARKLRAGHRGERHLDGRPRRHRRASTASGRRPATATGTAATWSRRAHRTTTTSPSPCRSARGYRIAVMYRPTAGSGAWVFPVAYSPDVRGDGCRRRPSPSPPPPARPQATRRAPR